MMNILSWRNSSLTIMRRCSYYLVCTQEAKFLLPWGGGIGSIGEVGAGGRGKALGFFLFLKFSMCSLLEFSGMASPH